MFVVDTNVLLHGIDAASPYHSRCRKRLEEWLSGAPSWYITWPIAYEFLRVSTHPRVLRQPLSLRQAWDFITTLLEASSLSVLVPTARHAEVAEQVFSEAPELRSNILHDAATAVLMREHGIRTIMTRDTDFHRFPFLEVIDPVH